MSSAVLESNAPHTESLQLARRHLLLFHHAQATTGWCFQISEFKHFSVGARKLQSMFVIFDCPLLVQMEEVRLEPDGSCVFWRSRKDQHQNSQDSVALQLCSSFIHYRFRNQSTFVLNTFLLQTRDPTSNLTFNLSMSDAEKQARSSTHLPFMKHKSA